MSRPLRVEYPGALYHVTARGNERRAIFRDDADRENYLDRLARYCDRFTFRVHAYCLMTNHVHLAIETSQTPLSRIMLSLHGSYSQSFNRRYGRVGHLFHGRYKAFLVQRDRYLLALVKYIHENPVKARIVKSADLFRWSSDRAYRTSVAPRWLEIDVALSLLAKHRRAAVRAYASLMATGTTTYEDLSTYAQVVRGDEPFAIRVTTASADPEVQIRALTPERVARAAATALEVFASGYGSAGWRLRAITGYVGRERARIPLTRTAAFFAKHGTTLVRDVRRLEHEMTSDANLREVVRWVNAELPKCSDSALTLSR